jgi:hypothetical protein
MLLAAATSQSSRSPGSAHHHQQHFNHMQQHLNQHQNQMNQSDSSNTSSPSASANVSFGGPARQAGSHRVQFIVPGEQFDLYGLVFYLFNRQYTIDVFSIIIILSARMINSVLSDVLRQSGSPGAAQMGQPQQFHFQAPPM